MGLLDFWKSKPVEQKPDHTELMLQLLQQQAERQQDMLSQMLETQRDQNETTRLLLSQYIGKGENTSSSLDERMFQKEDSVEWDELVENPFKGI